MSEMRGAVLIHVPMRGNQTFNCDPSVGRCSRYMNEIVELQDGGFDFGGGERQPPIAER